MNNAEMTLRNIAVLGINIFLLGDKCLRGYYIYISLYIYLYIYIYVCVCVCVCVCWLGGVCLRVKCLWGIYPWGKYPGRCRGGGVNMSQNNIYRFRRD